MKKRARQEPLVFHVTPETILHFIDQNAGVQCVQKKRSLGEVFTNNELIEDILSHLPSHVWQNPFYKWLEPSCGVGNMMLKVFLRLDEGLSFRFPDEHVRRHHILSHMLYMVDISPENVQVVKQWFGMDANVFEGDFLQNQWYTTFGVEQYDIIIGNPPFHSVHGKTGKGTVLWKPFVKRCEQLLSEEGYLGILHPCHWRAPGKWWEHRKQQYTFYYLRIYGKIEGRRLFQCNVRFDVYVMQKRIPHESQQTLVMDEYGHPVELSFAQWPFLPNHSYSHIFPLLTSKEQGIRVIFHSQVYHASRCQTHPTEEYCHPVIHTVNEKRVGLVYSSIRYDNIHYGEKKVILNLNEKQYAHSIQNDFQGQYGMSQLSFGIPIDSYEEGQALLFYIQSDVFQHLLSACKWNSFQTNHVMFHYFHPQFYLHQLKHT